MSHGAPRTLRSFVVPLLGVAVTLALGVPAVFAQAHARSPAASDHRQLLDRYCVTCHNERLETAGLRLDQVDPGNVGENAEVWEKVVRKLRAGTMPPSTRP